MDDQKLYADEILNEFKRVYGEKKYNKIKSDIENSKKSKELVHECLTKSLYPPGDQIVACVLSNFRYSFAKGDTLIAASLFLYKDWINVCTRDKYYPFHQIKQIEKEILLRIHKMSYDTSLSILKDPKVYK